jgi:hypothetical protein
MHTAERGEPIQTGSYRPEGYKPASLSHRLKNAFGILIVGGGLAAGCTPKDGMHPSQIPTMGGETPPATLVDPTPVPTEYMPPAVGLTETVPASTQAPLETPPPQISGNMPDIPVLSGIEPGAGGPELKVNTLTAALQQAINNADYGVVVAVGGTVSAETETQGTSMCISAIPESIHNPDALPTRPGNGELLKQLQNGVAKYEFTQVLAEVPVPPDTDKEMYACVLGYALSGNMDFHAGTLRQLLVHTSTTDGSVTVVGSMQAGYLMKDNVAVNVDIIQVNGQTLDWELFDGMELPAVETNWSLEIPGTIEACPNVIRSDTYAHTEEDIASLNKKIMEHKWFSEFPVGEFPPRTQSINIKPWTPPDPKNIDFIPYGKATVDMWFNYQNADGSDVNAIIASCSTYKDGYLFGAFIDINQQMVPVQVFIDPRILQNWLQYFKNAGLDDRPYEQKLVEDYQEYSQNGTSSMITLFGDFENYPTYKDSATGVLGTYLEQTYDYSNRIKRLFTGNAGREEADETIAIMQRIPLPGKVIYYSPDDK